MPRITGTSNAQTTFLRLFRTHPAGPPPETWPNPALLRRWLRRPAFVTALNSLREALRFQVDFHLAAAAAQAAQRLTTPGESPLTTLDLRRLSELLRLAHLRQRFPAATAAAPTASPATFALRAEIEELEECIDAFQQDRDARAAAAPDGVDHQPMSEHERHAIDHLASLRAALNPSRHAPQAHAPHDAP
ncbi:MAG: hypothetical protein JWQ20_4568 [Conexibacter sp.]|nr:hypothetical protein [Conexibacter sp.]